MNCRLNHQIIGFQEVAKRAANAYPSWRIGQIALLLMLAAYPLAGQKPAPYNVILVTPDQVRATMLHTYGNAWPDTPNIDRMARQGTLFLRAYSAGSWTTPSFATILTGLFPTVHGMTLPPYESCGKYITRPMTFGKIPPVPGFLRLSPHKPVLSEMLQKHGFTTAADVANCWAIWDLATRGWNTFKFYAGYQLRVAAHPQSESPYYLTAPGTTRWAQSWIKAHDRKRFFLWIHYMEPHSPYNAPASYDLFKTPGDYPQLNERNHKDSVLLHALAKMGNHRAIQRLKELYAAKILYMDHYVGKLMNTIRALGLRKNTIVIFLSDHGQLVYSHPRHFNTDDHRSLYDTDQHVPLIMWGADIPAGKRVNAIVGQYDVVPTILNLEHLPVPSYLDGKSLRPLLLGQKKQVHRYVYGEETAIQPQYSIRNTRYKLIESLRSGKTQCFDDLRDPAEKQNICALIPREAARLKAALDRHIQAMIQQAESYPDWRNNLALAVVQQRDSRGLQALAPRRVVIGPHSGASFQLTGSEWSLIEGACNYGGLAYWSKPGPNTQRILWRFDTPFTGWYEVAIRYGGLGLGSRKLATNANYTVRFKGGSLSFPVNQNQRQGLWIHLGCFYDPISIELTNQANGPILADVVRFTRLRPGAQSSTGSPARVLQCPPMLTRQAAH